MEEAGGAEGHPGARGDGEEQRKKIKMDRRGIKDLKARVGRECCISRRKAR